MRRVAFRARTDNYGVFAETMCEGVFGVTPPSRPPRDLDVQFQCLALDRGSLSMIENRGGEDLRVDRTVQRIAADSESTWLLGVCMRGAEVTSVATGHEITQPGRLRLMSSMTPHFGVTTMGTQIGMISFPDKVARAVCDTRRWAPGAVAPTPVGRILASYLTSVFATIDQLDQDDADQLVATTLQLLAAADLPAAAAVQHARPSLRALRRREILQLIDAHIADPALSPAWLAKRLGLSPRYLHALFDDQQQSLGATILDRRLVRCRDAILDPRNVTQSITEIAFRFGFSSSSHFSRVFRERFGAPPSELRRNRK